MQILWQVYVCKMQWTKAILVYNALWAVDGTCPDCCHAEQRRTCDARTKSKQCFLTANGYTVSLSRMKDRIRHQQMRSIFRGLWDSRTRWLDVLPATHIAKSYLAVLLALNDDLQAEILRSVRKPGLLRNRNARTGRSTK